MSNTILQDAGIKIRWMNGKLATIPPLAAMSPEQRAVLAAYRKAEEQRIAEEQQALFEIALLFAKDFVQDAFKLLGGFRRVSVPSLHSSYCESLARIMKGLVPPIGQAAFGEVLNDIERDAERQAMQSTDTDNQTTTETST